MITTPTSERMRMILRETAALLPGWGTTPDGIMYRHYSADAYAEVTLAPDVHDTIVCDWTMTRWDIGTRQWVVFRQDAFSVYAAGTPLAIAGRIWTELRHTPLVPNRPAVELDGALLPLHFDTCKKCGRDILVPPDLPRETVIDWKLDIPIPPSPWCSIRPVEPLIMDLRGAVRAWGHDVYAWPIAYTAQRGWEPTGDIDDALFYIAEHTCDGWNATRIHNYAAGLRLTRLRPDGDDYDPWDTRDVARLERAV